MHDTALHAGQKFFQRIAYDAASVLDVGSMDVNGTLRPFIPDGADYCGIDMARGPNVTLVLEDPYRFPICDREFDVCISSSCLEHSQMFWLVFLEMARVTRRYIYISAPVAGPIHRHPVDCWRFYPDAGKALEAWARWNGIDLRLMESFIIPPRGDVWHDFVAVFGIGAVPHRDLGEAFPEAIERFVI